MATILEPQQWQTDQRFVLPGVSWRFYELLLEEIGDRPIRVTYDRGNLELMSPSPAHEICKTLLGRLIEMLTFELDIPMRGGGSMTFRREELERGLEPDECYWIASVSLLPTRREYDPQRDPPPDLGIEIEYSRSTLDRQGIYAACGIVAGEWRVCALRTQCGFPVSAGRRADSIPAVGGALQRDGLDARLCELDSRAGFPSVAGSPGDAKRRPPVDEPPERIEPGDDHLSARLQCRVRRYAADLGGKKIRPDERTSFVGLPADRSVEGMRQQRQYRRHARAGRERS